MTTERVHFRLIQTPCCHTVLCYVNPRLPNYCSECGKSIFKDVRAGILGNDDNAILKYNLKET